MCGLACWRVVYSKFWGKWERNETLVLSLTACGGRKRGGRRRGQVRLIRAGQLFGLVNCSGPVPDARAVAAHEAVASGGRGADTQPASPT